MNKKILIIISAILILFTNESQVWASDLTYQANKNNVYEYKLELNFQNSLVADKSIFQLSELNNKPTYNPNLWLYSILVPGMGQIMLGDKDRGLKFTFSEIGIAALSLLLFFIYNQTGISQYNVSAPRTQANLIIGIASSIIGAILALILPFLHVWNIIDAFALSKELERKDKNSFRSDTNNYKILDFELAKF